MLKCLAYAAAAVAALVLIMPSALAQGFEGRFGNERVTLDLAVDAGSGGLVGTLTVDGAAYPCRATRSADGLQGSFQAGAGAYPFTARLEGEVLTLTSEGHVHALRRMGAPPQAPTAPRAGPVPVPAPAPTGTPLRPGMRVVWLQGSASIPGERNVLVPNLNGQWVSQATGRTYSYEDNPGTGGMGYTVADVVAVTDRHAFCDFNSYLLNPLDRTVTHTGQTALGLTLGAENDYWTDPRVLAGMQEVTRGDLRIVRMAYPLNGRTYRALRIQAQLTGGGWSQNTYDLETGLLIAGGSSSIGKTPAVVSPDGTMVPGRPATNLTFTQLVQVREVRLPGPGASVPASLRELRGLRYAGAHSMEIPGVPVMQLPLESRHEVRTITDHVIHTAMTTSLSQGIASDSFGVLGAVGTLWMDPRQLGALRPGTVLDDDPLIQTRILVAERSGPIVRLVRRSSMSTLTYDYDTRTGLLTRWHSRVDMSTGAQIMWVELAERW